MLKKIILSATVALGVIASAASAKADSTQVVTAFEAQKNAWYIFAGGVTALSGEDLHSQDGWLARVSGGYGQYSYSTVAVPGNNVDGTTGDGNLSIGYQHYFTPDVRGTVYLGGDLQNQHLDPRDPGARVDGTRGGVLGQGELFAMAAPKVPVLIIGQYSTAFRTYWTQGNVGYNFGPFTVGPSVGFQGSESYNEGKYGAKVSGIDLGFADASFEVGGEHNDRHNASGVYGGVGLLKNF